MAENQNFLSETLKVLFRSLNKILFEDLNGDLGCVLRGVEGVAEVDLGGVALADLLCDVPLVQKDWVLFG